VKTHPSLSRNCAMPHHQVHGSIRKGLRLRNKTLNHEKEKKVKTKTWPLRKEGIDEKELYGHEDGSSATTCAPRWDVHELYHQTSSLSPSSHATIHSLRVNSVFPSSITTFLSFFLPYPLASALWLWANAAFCIAAYGPDSILDSRGLPPLLSFLCFAFFIFFNHRFKRKVNAILYRNIFSYLYFYY